MLHSTFAKKEAALREAAEQAEAEAARARAQAMELVADVAAAQRYGMVWFFLFSFGVGVGVCDWLNTAKFCTLFDFATKGIVQVGLPPPVSLLFDGLFPGPGRTLRYTRLVFGATV